MFPLSCSRSRSLATSEWIVISKHDIGLVGDGDGDGAGPTFTLDWRFFLLLSLCLYFSIYNTLCPHFIFVFIHAGNHLFTFYMFSLFSPPQIYTHTHTYSPSFSQYASFPIRICTAFVLWIDEFYNIFISWRLHRFQRWWWWLTFVSSQRLILLCRTIACSLERNWCNANNNSNETPFRLFRLNCSEIDFYLTRRTLYFGFYVSICARQWFRM